MTCNSASNMFNLPECQITRVIHHCSDKQLWGKNASSRFSVKHIPENKHTRTVYSEFLTHRDSLGIFLQNDRCIPFCWLFTNMTGSSPYLPSIFPQLRSSPFRPMVSGPRSCGRALRRCAAGWSIFCCGCGACMRL